MFAKRQPAFVGVQAPQPGGRFNPRALLEFAKKPWVAMTGAAVVFVGAATGLVLVAGDPFAGAPSIKASITRPSATGPGATAPATGADVFTLDNMGMGQDVTVPGFDLTDAPPVQGTAVITLPDGDGIPGGSPASVAQSSMPVTRRAPGSSGIAPGSKARSERNAQDFGSSVRSSGSGPSLSLSV